MSGNTRSAFLKNIKAGITCPSCGSRISLSEPGSYRAVLNESTRNSASSLVNAQRHIYTFWNQLLNECNFPADKYPLPSPLLEKTDDNRYLNKDKILKYSSEETDEELIRRYKVAFEKEGGDPGEEDPGFQNNSYRYIRDGVSQTRGALIFSAMLDNSRVFRFEEAIKSIPKHSNLYAGSQCIYESKTDKEGQPVESDIKILTDFLTSINDNHVSSPIVSVVFSQSKVAEWKYKTAREVIARWTQLAREEPATDEPPMLLENPTDGDPDDLSEIKGIKEEKAEQLNNIGIYYFSQIVEWGESHVAWIASETDTPKGLVKKWVTEAKKRNIGNFSENNTCSNDRYPKHAILTKLLDEKKLLPPKYDMLIEYIAIAEAILRQHHAFFNEKLFTKGGELKSKKGKEDKTAYDVFISIVEQALFGLAVLGEHKDDEGKFFVQQLQILDLSTQGQDNHVKRFDQVGPSSLYELPRAVEVSQKQLNALVRWAPGLYLNIFNLPDTIHKAFLDDYCEWKSIVTKEDIETQDKYFDQSLATLVDFRCQGPPATLFNLDRDESKDRPTPAIFVSAQCGWFPKEEETHPIVLIGSPGCGKTNTTIAGIPTFLSDLGALGINIWPHLGIDSTQAARMHQYFRSLKMPKPTPAEHRHVVEIKARHPVSNRTEYYLFIDIPGELAVRGRTITHGEHELVLSTVRNAEYLCFFYDLTLDRPLRREFSQNHSVWENVNKVIKRVVGERTNKSEGEAGNKPDAVNDPFDYDKSRANFEQMELCHHFLDLVFKQRGDLKNLSQQNQDEAEKTKTPKCIVVIPKADLYASPNAIFNQSNGDSTPYFFDGFYEFVQYKGLLERGLDETGNLSESLDYACSHGPQFGGVLFDREQRIKETKILLRELSDKAKESLKKISNMSLTPDQNDGEYTGHTLPRLTDHINGMISGFESMFGETNVWFLPVSARGNPKLGCDDTTPQEHLGDNAGREYPPQKLSEFLFLLPVIESYSKHPPTENKGDDNQQPDSQQDPDESPVNATGDDNQVDESEMTAKEG